MTQPVEEKKDRWPIPIFCPTAKGSINGQQIVVMPATMTGFGLILPDLAGLTPLLEENALEET